MANNDQDIIKRWSLLVRRGDAFRKKLYTDAQWSRFEGYFRNKYPVVRDSDRDVERKRLKVRTNDILAREARRMVPKVTFGIPYLRVTPLAGRMPLHAKVLERTINGILDAINFGEELAFAGLSTIQHGTSFIKVGYDSVYVPSYKDIAERGYSLRTVTRKGERLEYSDNVFPGMPWATWQHPRNVVYPALTRRFEDSQWVAFQYLRPLAEIKADKRLSNTADLQPIPHHLTDIDSSLTAVGEYDYINDLVLCTEIRDKHLGMLYIFAEGHHAILYKEKDVLIETIGHLPVHPLVFNFNTDYAWGSSDIEGAEEDLKELMDVETQRTIDRRTRVNKFAYRKNTISREEMKRYTDGTAGGGLEVDGNLDDSIKALAMPPQMDLIAEANNLASSIRDHFGSNAFGTFPTSRRTGEEVQGSQQDSMALVMAAGERVRDLTVAVGKDIANMVFDFWTEDAVVDVLSPVTETMPDGTQQDVTKQIWVAFKGKELRGGFDYTITPSAGRMQSAQENKREALEMIKFFSQVPGVNPQELLRQFSDRFGDIDVDKLFMPMNSPAQPVGMEQLLQSGQLAQGGNMPKGLQQQKPNL